MIAASVGVFLPGLVVAVVIGLLCMRSAGNFAGKYGRPPWGLPNWAWFIIGFLLGIVGAIVYGIAYFTSKRQAEQRQMYAPPAYPPPPAPTQSWQEQMGAQPAPPPPPGEMPRYPTSGPAEQPYPPPVPPPSVPPPSVPPPSVPPPSVPPPPVPPPDTGEPSVPPPPVPPPDTDETSDPPPPG